MLSAGPSNLNGVFTQTQDTDLGLGFLSLYEVGTDNRRKLV